MNSIMSLPSFGPAATREFSCANGQVDGPTAVERLCADILSALKRFSDIVESDPTGTPSQAERLAVRDLNRALRAASQCRCQNLYDLYAKSRTHEAMKVWFPPHDPRMQLFASNLAGELFQFLERCQAANSKAADPAGQAQAHEGGSVS